MAVTQTVRETVRNVVAANVKALRRDSSFSASDLAQKSGVDRTYWYLLEKGQVNFTIDKLEGVADVLGVTVRDLLEPPKKKPRPRKSREPLGAGK